MADYSDDAYWGEKWFPGFSNESKTFWLRFEEVTDTIHTKTTFLNFYIATIGAPLNLLHLFFLSRRSMLTSSTNIIMIAIAICDFITMSDLVRQYVAILAHLWRASSPDYKCWPPENYYIVFFYAVMDVAGSCMKECAVWFAVLLSAVRTLVIRNPGSARSEKLCSPKFGLLSILFVLMLSLPLALISRINTRVVILSTWKPGINCTNFPPNYTQPYYIVGSIDIFHNGSTFTNAKSWAYHIIPSLILPISAISLVLALRKAEERRKNLQGNNSEITKRLKTTKLVLAMTATFIFAVLPQGVLLLLLIVSTQYQGFTNILVQVSAIFYLSYSINSILHVCICFFMSSQYRETVRITFGIAKKVVPQPIWEASTKNNQTGNT